MITTKKGDKGQTSLADGRRVGKDDLRIEVNGQIDELNCLLGLCKVATGEAEPYATLQRELMQVMAAVAGRRDGIEHLRDSVARMEETIADCGRRISPVFVLPGTSMANAAIHMARAKSRTCERRLVALDRQEPLPDGLIVYMNRLSDYLFSLSFSAKVPGED
ncbi:MAG: cob(I)yrinic acid a,c-diamide adenosyltransferase [Prevotella sp.]|nr:cob(I)yrinic acid a,c-diamide adenosyltransferase [Prevotella sp.]